MKANIITVLVLSLITSVAVAQPKKEVIHCVKVGKTLVCTSN